VHLLFFLFVAAASLIVLPMVLAIGIQVYRHQTQPDFQQLASNAGFLIATQMLWFGTVFFFLYLTLSVLRDAPFWSTMGWTRLGEYAAGKRYRPWMFASSGGGLAIFVAVGSSRVKGADDTPIEQLFKNPHAAFLLMAMAVFVAPLVEETVFRGYLYPLFASKLSQAAVYFGADARQALRIGTASGVLLTGFLFGMMHGSQLGWNLMLVGLLTTVGVIFTLARAITGTVLASFLMHLGYNSLIALTSIISTKGFQVVPPGH
jgi:membrane protease YdiL (CAAX protease family)